MSKQEKSLEDRFGRLERYTDGLHLFVWVLLILVMILVFK